MSDGDAGESTTATGTEVRGTVRLMTSEPIPVHDLDSLRGTLWARICSVLADRPWLAPAGLAVFVLLVIAIRRRGAD